MARRTGPARRTAPAGRTGPAGGSIPAGGAAPARGAAVDEVDRAIIAQLQQAGRRPFTEIARGLGLSEATVRNRVGRLERRGILQIVGVIAPLRLGLRRVLIGVRVRGHAVAEVEQVVRVMPEIDYVAVTTGGFDLVLMAACRDEEHIAELVTQRLRAVPGVDGIDVVTILRETKDAYHYVSGAP